MLDTCVLYGQTLRDVLLTAAELKLLQPHFSLEILEELRRYLVEDGRMTGEQAARLVEAIESAFPQALVPVNPAHLASLQNDRKDRHVLSIAIEAPAQFIVTDNITDFAKAATEPHGVQVRTADQFLMDLLAMYPRKMPSVLRRVSAGLSRPPLSPAEVAEAMSKVVPHFSKAMRTRLLASDY